MTSPLEAFRKLYADRHAAARAWKAKTGGKVVGYVGTDVPEEMIIAAGMLPVRVVGDPEGSTAAVAPHVEETADPGVKSIAARLMDGTYDYLDHVVIGVSPTIYGWLYNFFVEMRRLDPRVAAPRPVLFDFFRSRYRTSALFNRETLARFRRTLDEWAGVAVSDGALKDAIALCNHNRRLLAEIAALRAAPAPRLSGAEALEVIGSSFTTPKADHNARLRALLAAADQLPVRPGLPVVYSGTETETLKTYQAIEAGGAVIVADDQEWGSGAVETLTDESLDPIDAICDRYQFRSPAVAGRSVAERKPHLLDMLRRSGAKAVVFNILAIDHPASWDYPRLRDFLNANGAPTVEFGPRAYRADDSEALSAQVARFVAGAERAPAA